MFHISLTLDFRVTTGSEMLIIRSESGDPTRTLEWSWSKGSLPERGNLWLGGNEEFGGNHKHQREASQK